MMPARATSTLKPPPTTVPASNWTNAVCVAETASQKVHAIVTAMSWTHVENVEVTEVRARVARLHPHATIWQKLS